MKLGIFTYQQPYYRRERAIDMDYLLFIRTLSLPEAAGAVALSG
jgi:hypothetical protein